MQYDICSGCYRSEITVISEGVLSVAKIQLGIEFVRYCKHHAMKNASSSGICDN